MQRRKGHSTLVQREREIVEFGQQRWPVLNGLEFELLDEVQLPGKAGQWSSEKRSGKRDRSHCCQQCDGANDEDHALGIGIDVAGNTIWGRVGKQ